MLQRCYSLLDQVFLFECKSAQHIPLQTEFLGVGAVIVCSTYFINAHFAYFAYFINAHFEDHVDDVFLALL